MLDHFENVSLVYNGNELEIFNVQLTDDSMELSVDQPVLFPGRYTLTIHRYKGLIGSAIYYRYPLFFSLRHQTIHLSETPESTLYSALTCFQTEHLLYSQRTWDPLKK